jgi:hypothetical protein
VNQYFADYLMTGGCSTPPHSSTRTHPLALALQRLVSVSEDKSSSIPFTFFSIILLLYNGNNVPAVNVNKTIIPRHLLIVKPL